MKNLQTIVKIALALGLIGYTYQAFQCPTLSCDSPIGGDYCFLHSGDSPVTQIRTFKCPSDQWCYLEDGQYAWVRSFNQNMSRLDLSYKNNSQVFYRYTQKHCEDITTFQQQLQNGRKCQVSAQCLSNTCDETTGKCIGKTEGVSCSSHEECNVGLACNPDTGFPFATTCKKMFTSGICANDNECDYTHFCWPSLPNSKQRECLQLFSQEMGKMFGVLYDDLKSLLENSLEAGKYCKSGIAAISTNKSIATCVEIDKITTNINRNDVNSTTPISSPYYCSLEDEHFKACKYWYKSGTGVNQYSLIATEYCDCSLDEGLNNKSIGICPYPGQDQLDTYVDSLQLVLQYTKCQTVDWMNMAAQKDCGVGAVQGGELYSAWQKAVQSQFNITYWQYIQTPTTRQCMEEVMSTSLTNLEKEIGIITQVGLVLLASILTFILL
ncbi:UNKNOWN [Stylonychia lemnae]|uniref:Dickkopf N-terminal cysteine-rich domain-containing protein n=1 Tax=Stylonychia lemnae TaxID=5949 RepID=A0A078ABL7_STYLE|nr:UNKNOWN [Stylonychia lemnae]|eukprot:CDW79579.1 UNKNOWN [Stylonychia lemnae]